MVKIKILASGSSGNAYLISDGTIKMLIDPGIHYNELMKRMNFKLSEINHTLVSHEHKDHCTALSGLRKTGMSISMSRGTGDALGIDLGVYHVMESEKVYDLYGWKIMPFRCEHDAAEPLGFLIQLPGGSKVCYATDTAYIRYRFTGVTHWMIECNYSEELLQKNNDLDSATKSRIRTSHFEIENVKKFFENQDLEKTEKIYLIHLSDSNSDEKLFVKEIEAMTGVSVFTLSD